MPESESREMYLKSIYEIADGEEPVAVSLLAKRMGVSPVSATEMVKRLRSWPIDHSHSLQGSRVDRYRTTKSFDRCSAAAIMGTIPGGSPRYPLVSGI